MLGTILSVVGGLNSAFDLYRNVGTLVKGDGTERVLSALHGIHEQVVKLNDNIWYAPRLRGLADTTQAAATMADPRSAREMLDPVQRAIGGDIVSSGLIETPHKMEMALSANPWAVLTDIRPQHLAVSPVNPDMVPVMFVHGGVRYIGWQMRGTLPMLFNCELDDLPGLGGSPLAAGAAAAKAVRDTSRIPLEQQSTDELLRRRAELMTELEAERAGRDTSRIPLEQRSTDELLRRLAELEAKSAGSDTSRIPVENLTDEEVLAELKARLAST